MFMQKVNQLYGKDIIQQSSGNRIGTVRDVILDSEVRQVVALLVDDRQLLSNTRVVRWSMIVGAGDVIVIASTLPLPTIEEDTEVAELVKQANRITGTTILSEGGVQIGTAGDLFIDEHGEIVGYEVKQGLFTDLRGRKFLPVSAVRAVGKDALIAADSELATVKDTKREQNAPLSDLELPPTDGTV
jgi:uncharacterized protein YrrD